ncbi:MAG: peptide deformylase [Candidatus Omnitrophica bacterium]|nr:peptide deformylase [Candidatus Omnitrophota bacterium]
MAILKVARLGHPVLRQKAEPVGEKEIKSLPIQQLIDDMTETMHEYEGVGIAAPQVHVSKQIAVIEVRQNSRYPEAPEIPLMVLINPRVASRSKKMIEGWEGCLSIPDLRGQVPRHESLICEALNREGRSVRIEASGFFARVIQHEWDHLQGCVYLDAMKDLKSLAHLQEFARFWAK